MTVENLMTFISWVGTLDGPGVMALHFTGFVFGWWVYGKQFRAVRDERDHYRKEHKAFVRSMASQLGINLDA